MCHRGGIGLVYHGNIVTGQSGWDIVNCCGSRVSLAAMVVGVSASKFIVLKVDGSNMQNKKSLR